MKKKFEIRNSKFEIPVQGRVIFEYVLLAICLCVLALRTTFTESPTAQSMTSPEDVGDVVYSLSVSAVLIFCLVFWLVWSFCSNRFIYRFTGIEIGLCLFAIAATIASFAASDKRLAETSAVMLLAPPLMAIMLAQILDCQAKIKLVLTVIAALGVVCACESFYQLTVTNQAMIEQYQQASQTLLEPLGIEPGTLAQFLFEHRLFTQGVRGFFTTRNSAGCFTLMASFAAIALFIDKLKYHDEEKPPVKLGAKYLNPYFLTGAAVAIIIFGLILTRSKGAIIGSLFAAALFIAYLFFGQQAKAHKKGILIFCLLSIIAGSWLVIWYGLKHNRLPGGSGMLVRWQYWHASAKIYADHPLTGVGPGNFTFFYPHYKPAEALESVADPHNFLLSILTQYGPLGLVGFLAMILVPLWRATSVSSIEYRVSSIEHRVSSKALAITFLIVISAALLLIRPMIMPAAPADTLDVLIYVILTLYIAPVAAFVIGFLLLTAPSQEKRATSRERRATTTIAVLFCVVLGVLLHNLIDFAIFEPGVLATFWALIACLIAENRSQTTEDRGQRTEDRLLSSDFCLLTCVFWIAAVALILIVFVRYAWWPVYKSTANIHQAHRAASLGQFEQAHDFLAAAAESDLLDPTALNLNGRLHLQRYEVEKQPAQLVKAEQCFLKAIERNQADYKNYEKLGTVYEMLGQMQKAYDWCVAAAELYPGSGQLQFKLGQIADKLGKTDTAIQQYKKAVEIEDKFRRQFQMIYPERKEIVSRLGEEKYQFAKKRLNRG